MKKVQFAFLLMSFTFPLFGQFEPAAGQPGSSAIHKDSSVFVAWAVHCRVTRGFMDISNPSSGYASTGDSSMAVGSAGNGGVVSLGDGGNAVLTFGQAITNGPGPDFAVFENAFSDLFLELAFVEVSSDGVNYFRFPATSNTQDTLQTGAFDPTDCTLLNNLAGKYRANFGTPFDLQELSNQPGLNVNAITHVKIIDVVGCIQPAFASFDQYGNKVNDPWPTSFPSSGFDLDGVGVIHAAPDGINDLTGIFSSAMVFPNPASASVNVQYTLNQPADVRIVLCDYSGKVIQIDELSFQMPDTYMQAINTEALSRGMYFVRIEAGENTEILKLSVACE